MSLKKIDLQAGSFEANGKKYLIETTLSIGRYRKYEEIEIETGYGRSFKDLYDNVRQAYDDLNKSKPADASVKLYNLINGITDPKKKEPFVLRYCALFMNTEEEERASITDDQIQAKISDWQQEGLDIDPFFQFAIHSLPGFLDRYKKLTATS